MCKRLIAVITLSSIYMLLPSALSRARAAISPITFRSAKEKGAACAPCARGNSPSDSIDSLATLGRRTQPLPFAPLSRTTFEGATVNLVATATGHLAFSVTDLSVAGALPITFRRVYASDRSVDAGLGVGWSFSFDDRIKLEGDSATLTTGGGAVLGFSREAGGGFSLKTPEPNPHQSFVITDAETITERADGMARTYKRIGNAFRLRQIADDNGNKITISFDARGNLTRISNDGGGALELEWSGGSAGRLLSVSDNAGRQVSFRQDGQRLRAVTDSSGAQLSYDYENGRLTRAADALGRNALRVRYDKNGRVTETGDEAGLNHYQYEVSSGISRRTVVTDPIGLQTIYEHTERGLLSAVTDVEGATVRIEYGAAARPLRVANSFGDETIFTYDASQRLVRQTSAGSTDVAYTYDEQGRVSSVTKGGDRTDYTRDSRGNITAAQSSDPAASYQATLNARGQTVALKSGNGSEFSSEYDAAGNETAYSFSDMGRFVTERDATGRLVVERLPSGLAQRYEYDSRGRLLKRSDNRGRALTFERDASGALTGLVTPQGRWIRATRDAAGRIIAQNNSTGKSRRFSYDARGALTEYTDARGQRKRVGYDRRGRVREITDGEGNQTRIERDLRGRPQGLAFSQGAQPGAVDPRTVKLSVRGGGFLKDATARFLTSSFGPPTAMASNTALAQAGDCFFGYDSFYDNWGWDSWGDGGFGDFGFSPLDTADAGCYDPFGSLFGGCGWSGGFDSWFTDPWSGCGFFGETCEQCRANQRMICQTERDACAWRVAQSVLDSSPGCIALAFVTAGLALLICLGLLSGSAAAGGIACHSEYQACLLRRIGNCPQCN